VKMKAANAFCKTLLKRATISSLGGQLTNHLNGLQLSPEQRQQWNAQLQKQQQQGTAVQIDSLDPTSISRRRMLQDWMQLDFSFIATQTSLFETLDRPCSVSLPSTLLQDITHLLAKESGVEQWSEWLHGSILSNHIFAAERREGRTNSSGDLIHDFVLKWSFFSANVQQELTFMQAESLPMFRLLLGWVEAVLNHHMELSWKNSAPESIGSAYHYASSPFSSPVPSPSSSSTTPISNSPPQLSSAAQSQQQQQVSNRFYGQQSQPSPSSGPQGGLYHSQQQPPPPQQISMGYWLSSVPGAYYYVDKGSQYGGGSTPVYHFVRETPQNLKQQVDHLSRKAGRMSNNGHRKQSHSFTVPSIPTAGPVTMTFSPADTPPSRQAQMPSSATGPSPLKAVQTRPRSMSQPPLMGTLGAMHAGSTAQCAATCEDVGYGGGASYRPLIPSPLAQHCLAPRSPQNQQISRHQQHSSGQVPALPP